MCGERPANLRIFERPTNVGTDGDWPRQIETLNARQPPQSIRRAIIPHLRKQRRIQKAAHQRAAAERRNSNLRTADGLPPARRHRPQRKAVV